MPLIEADEEDAAVAAAEVVEVVAVVEANNKAVVNKTSSPAAILGELQEIEVLDIRIFQQAMVSAPCIIAGVGVLSSAPPLGPAHGRMCSRQGQIINETLTSSAA